MELDEEYITEFSRIFRERLKGHLKVPSPAYDHCKTTGHITKVDYFNIEKGGQKITRTIKESIYRTVNNPSINRTIDKSHLPHMLGEALLTP